MLSAFTARPIVELKSRDKSKIESILAYGDRLLVGLSTGSLRIYRVNELPERAPCQNGSSTSDDASAAKPDASATVKPVDLLRELEKFSPKPIEQLAIIKEANILISLSSTLVSIHDLQSYTLDQQLLKTKGASTFAVTSNIIKDSATGIPEIISRLAVAVKRKVLLWSWHESELSEDVTEVSLPNAIRSLTWASATKIVCGMNSGYVIVDITTRETEDIVGPGAIGGASGSEGGRFGGVGSASMGYMGLGGYIPKPLSTRLGEGEMLLAKDINSLFIDQDGTPIERRQIPWAQSPESVGYSYPYLITLQSGTKGVLEVRNPETLALLQSVPLPNASQLHFPPPTVSLPHAGKGFHVLSDRSIWRMGAIDYDSQVDELVEGEKYDEAISVLGMLEEALLKDKTGRLREIKMLKAQLFFDQRRYQDSLDLFTDVEAPPERVIRLYPRSVAGDLTSLEEVDDSVADPSEDSPADDDEGSRNEEATKQREISVEKDKNGSKPATAPVNKFLKGHVKSGSVDGGSIRSSRRGHGGSDQGSIRGKQVEERALEGKDLITAVRALGNFLVGTRTRLQRFLDPVTGKLKTLDVETQNGNSKQAFDSLLLAPSSEEATDREQQLLAAAKLVDTTLFRAWMLATPSLVGSLFRLPNFCDPEVVGEKLIENHRYTDLIDFYHGKKLHRPALELLQKFGQANDDDECAAGLDGPERTIGYLQALPPDMIDLILEFATWPLEADPKNAMEIFVGDTENAETLARDKVLRFLEDKDVSLTETYLEHIINELHDDTPVYHDKLIAAYVQELRNRTDRKDPSWQNKMEKLLDILRTTRIYSGSKAFSLIPRDDPDFYETLAVVLSNLGNHKQALEVYVFKLKDFDKAEEYCNQVHVSQESDPESPNQLGSRRKSTSGSDESLPSIYHTLLSIYLTPPSPYQPNWQPALSLLSKHGARLPASSTLNIIPKELPVAELESYFQGRIRAANSIVNESRIVAGLRKSEVVSAQAELLLGDGAANGAGGRNRRVVVGEERVCGVCHKRIGRSTVIAVLPDNSVVHYGCLSRSVAGQMGRSDSGGMNALRRGSSGYSR